MIIIIKQLLEILSLTEISKYNLNSNYNIILPIQINYILGITQKTFYSPVIF